jgi:hypothetical protein
VTAEEDITSIPAELLKRAADTAIETGKGVIIRTAGLVVVPDLAALQELAQGEDVSDTQRYYREDGREVLVYRWPSWAPVDAIPEDEQ